MSKIKQLLESDTVKSFTASFVDEYVRAQNRKAHQLNRIKNLTIDFDVLVQRAIAKHHTHILLLLFRIAEEAGIKIKEPIDKFTGTFPFDGYEYNNYLFILVYGQGTQMSIYQNNIYLWSL
jgi:hypothetical protein